MSDTMRIFVKDYEAMLMVGAYASEKKAPQKILISVEIEADLIHRFDKLGDDTLVKVIDYSQIHAFIQNELSRMGHIPLLETVAEQIINFCFRDPRAKKVKVRIEKPKLFSGANAGIEMCRKRAT